MAETKHTPGAMRAGKRIVNFLGITKDNGLHTTFAGIIDEETAAPELLKALKHIAAGDCCGKCGFDEPFCDVMIARTTLAKAEPTPEKGDCRNG